MRLYRNIQSSTSGFEGNPILERVKLVHKGTKQGRRAQYLNSHRFELFEGTEKS